MVDPDSPETFLRSVEEHLAASHHFAEGDVGRFRLRVGSRPVPLAEFGVRVDLLKDLAKDREARYAFAGFLRQASVVYPPLLVGKAEKSLAQRFLEHSKPSEQVRNTGLSPSQLVALAVPMPRSLIDFRGAELAEGIIGTHSAPPMTRRL